MNEWITDPGEDLDGAERSTAPAAFIDMSDVARARLQGMGGELGEVAAVFAQVAGPQLARVAMPVALKRGVLRVRCTSASWAQSLTFVEAELLEGLRGRLPAVTITSIRPVVGAAPNAATPPRETPSPHAISRASTPLDEPTDAALRRAAEAIADPDLRARVLAAARASTQRAREGSDPRS